MCPVHDRTGETWEAVSFMNGERIFVVMKSRSTRTRHGTEATVHTVLHISGKKLGRVLVQTEDESNLWESATNMKRLG